MRPGLEGENSDRSWSEEIAGFCQNLTELCEEKYTLCKGVIYCRGSKKLGRDREGVVKS